MATPTTNTTQELGSSSHGIDLITFALLNSQTGNILTGSEGLSDNGLAPIYQGVQGATNAEYQNLEREGTKVYANDVPKRVTRPTQAPTASLTFLDIDWTVLNKLIGYEQSDDGGYSLSSGAKPYFAMLTRSTFLDGSALYEAFACATAILPGNPHQTDNDSEQDANVTLTVDAYQPINPNVFKLKSGKQAPYRKWNSMDKNFNPEQMIQSVFPGYTIDDTMSIVVPSYKPKDSTNTAPNAGNQATQPKADK